MVDFHIELPSAGRLLRVFQRLRERVASRDLYRRVGEEIVARTRGRFRTKRSPEGTRWKDWSDPYAETRGPGKSLLIDEGDLERSIESQIAGNRLQILSTVDYAGHVQRARPYLGVSQDDERAIMELIEDRVAGGLRGA